MKKEGKVQGILITCLVLTIVGMSVGFASAAFNQTLELTGSATAKKASWDIHFVNYHEATGEGYVSGGSYNLDTSNTTLTYSVTLNPNEKYDFTIDAKNFGTFDAKLVGITMDGALSSEEAKYLSYTVIVDGVAYTKTTTGLNSLLSTGDSHQVHVSIEYRCPEDYNDLPTKDVTKTFTINLDYQSVLEN